MSPTRAARCAAFALVVVQAAVVVASGCNTYSSVANAGPADGGDDDGSSDSDAPDSADAPADANPFGDAGCSWFCESFDEATWPGPGWDPLTVLRGAVLGTVDAPHFSPPHALEAFLGADASANAVGLAPRTYFGSFAEVRCSMQLQLQAVATTDLATLVSLDFQDEDAGTWSFTFAVNGYKSEIDLGETNAVAPDVIDIFPLGVWLEIGFDVRLGNATRFTVNGGVQNHLAQSPAADAGPRTFVRAHLELGANRTASGKDWRVDYDDVACDVLP
jgi:hypothetical protein